MRRISFQQCLTCVNLIFQIELFPYGILFQIPGTVVLANTVDTFKARLDRFWSDQEVKYNWKSDIITGSRSQVSFIIE